MHVVAPEAAAAVEVFGDRSGLCLPLTLRSTSHRLPSPLVCWHPGLVVSDEPINELAGRFATHDGLAVTVATMPQSAHRYLLAGQCVKARPAR